MRVSLPIEDLRLGHFVEAQVQAERVDGELRCYLAPRDAVYGTGSVRKVRLSRALQKQVSLDGGLLLRRETQVRALRDSGLAALTIDEARSATTACDTPDEAPGAEVSGDLIVARGAPAAAVASGGMRYSLGVHGFVEVDVSPDGHHALLTALSFGGNERLRIDDVRRVLRDDAGLQEGIDDGLLQRLTARAAADPRRVVRGSFLIAEMPPALESTEDVDCLFLRDVETPAGDLPFADLASALSRESLDEVLAHAPVARAVSPGEAVARLAPAEMARRLLDVFGEKPADEGKRALSLSGRHLVSEIFGYACRIDDLTVLSPVWISPDESQAWFIDLPQVGAGRQPTEEDLQALLEHHGITHGVQPQALAEIHTEAPRPRAILLAQGVAPVPGEDARIDFTFEAALWPGSFQADGTVNFRERNAFHAVTQNQLLGTYRPATLGTPGLSVRGVPLEVEPGERRTFYTNDNVHVTNAPRQYFSRVTGTAHFRDDRLTVHEVLRIDGDVDYDLGNIEAGRDVHITGSVQPGFSIRLAGDLVVEGLVEDGAAIEADGDVLAAGGIVGAGTNVVAGGSVHARFVQNSTVTAGGDVIVGSYLLNARVRAGDRIVVRFAEGHIGGCIAGGEAYATRRVDAWTLGAASTDRTVVGIIGSPRLQEELRKAQKAVDYCDRFILRAFRSLGLNEVDTVALRELLARTPRHERAPLRKVMSQVQKVAVHRARSLARRNDLRARFRGMIWAGEVQVRDTAHRDVEIRAGGQQLLLDSDVARPTFRLTRDGIRDTNEEST